MARTFRNTNTVPTGWTVRDNGRVFHEDAPRDSYGNEDVGHPRRYRRSIYRCETKAARKATHRFYRNRVTHLMRNERYDDILPFTRTSGWVSW